MKKRTTGNQIVAKLRQAVVLIGKGKSVAEVCREIAVSEQTYYRWRQKYGGMGPEIIKELRELPLTKLDIQIESRVADSGDVQIEVTMVIDFAPSGAIAGQVIGQQCLCENVFKSQMSAFGVVARVAAQDVGIVQAGDVEFHPAVSVVIAGRRPA